MPVPTNPKIGQLMYDYPTRTMRRWNGKHWAETTTDEVKSDIKNRKKCSVDVTPCANKTPKK